MFSPMETKQWDPSRPCPVHLWLIFTCLLSLQQNISMKEQPLVSSVSHRCRFLVWESPARAAGVRSESSLAELSAKVKTLHHIDELHPNAIIFIHTRPHAWRNLKPSQDEKHLRHRYYGVTCECQAESCY